MQRQMAEEEDRALLALVGERLKIGADAVGRGLHDRQRRFVDLIGREAVLVDHVDQVGCVVRDGLKAVGRELRRVGGVVVALREERRMRLGIADAEERVELLRQVACALLRGVERAVFLDGGVGRVVAVTPTKQTASGISPEVATACRIARTASARGCPSIGVWS